MEIHFQLNYKMPKEVIQAFHITEDTAFETYFENGVLYIRALSEEENQSAFPEECDGNCESCAFSECCPYEKAEPEACSVKSPQFEPDSDDDGDELTEDGAFLKKWTKEQKYGIIVDTSKEEKRCQQPNTPKTSKSQW